MDGTAQQQGESATMSNVARRVPSRSKLTSRPATRHNTPLVTKLWTFLKADVTRSNDQELLITQPVNFDQIVSFLLIPFALEKVMLVGFLICVDSFLYTFTILPLRFVIAVVRVMKAYLPNAKTSTVLPAFKVDIIKTAVLASTIYLLTSLNGSILYHNIRGQSAVKLYVMFNVLEIADKLFCSFGQDVLEVLFAGPTLANPVQMYLFSAIAVVYNFLHSAALFCQMITLNVAVNSYSNALLTLLLSNQFGEIKSTVFKRFERENLFQMTCADIAERFQLWAMLLIIGLRNIVEVSGSTGGVVPQSWQGWNRFIGALFGPAVVVLGSEVCVDWLKHSYIAKFNKLKPKVYSRFLDVFCRDHIRNSDVGAGKQLHVTKRLGVPVLALFCVFVKSNTQLVQMIMANSQFDLPTQVHESAEPSPADGPGSGTTSTSQSTSNVTFASSFGLDILNHLSSSLEGVIQFGFYLGILLAVYLLLLVIKLLLGVTLLEYSRRRIDLVEFMEAKARAKAAVAQVGGAAPPPNDDPYADEKVSGQRRGGLWRLVDMGSGIQQELAKPDPDEDPQPATKLSSHEKKKSMNLQDVNRFQMIAKYIW
ncbi:eukaryotic membrane protein family-domain-containing protein [Limtongia smithiae]|uniref:eukaryotic membrane protein family-domain-containing protein n=1 Tax=Limtongia smithiae TaxID=1125753 RepID=UPI0034CD0719